MPNHDWVCTACRTKNPPYTEACRDCYAPAEPGTYVRHCSDLKGWSAGTTQSWKDFWTYEGPKSNEIPVVPPTDKAVATYLGLIGGYLYLKYNDITPSSLTDYIYVGNWFSIWAFVGFGMAGILQLCVAERRADRKFYIDKDQVALRFLIRRLLDVGLFFSGALVMQYFWICLVS
jgi:hypothetical protein